MPYFSIYIRSVVSAIVLFWAIMQFKLWVGGIVSIKEAIVMVCLLAFTFYILVFDIIRLSRHYTLAESLLFCTLGVWTYLYPRFSFADIALLLDSALFSLQYNVFYLFNVV